jgi:hypothetical protein
VWPSDRRRACPRRSALGRRFEGGQGPRQHALGIARPLIELGLGLVTPPGQELFHSPDFHIPSDLVVDHWTSEGESRSHPDVLLLHDVWTTSNHLSGHKIVSTISMV